jgi:single-stranded-DNA-specific exonuclease
MAAGVTVRRDRFDAFRERFERVCLTRLGTDDLGPEQRVDLEIQLGEVSVELERLIRHLEPCGMGNPAPVFGVRGVSFARRQRVGTNHLRGTLEGKDANLGAIGFQLADRVPWLGDGPVDAAFRLEENEYQGRTSLQARILSLTPHRAEPAGVVR